MSSTNASLSNIAKNQGAKTLNSSKKAMNKQVKGFKEASPLKKIFIILVVVLLFLFLLYWINYAIKQKSDASTKNPVIISSPIDAWKTYNQVSIPVPPEGQELSISTWFYMKNFQYKLGQWKNLLWIGIPPTSKNGSGGVSYPNISFYPFTNALKLVTSTSNNGQQSCDIQNVPFNKWVHVTYVLNNRTVDVYINGKLERSCVLQGLPLIKNKMYIKVATQGGFYGKIGRTQYFTSALSSNDVLSLYNRGPLGSTAYKINFFTDGNIVSAEQTDGYNN
jgi:hypothetical protein